MIVLYLTTVHDNMTTNITIYGQTDSYIIVTRFAKNLHNDAFWKSRFYISEFHVPKALFCSVAINTLALHAFLQRLLKITCIQSYTIIIYS